jgi:hypothetical protein
MFTIGLVVKTICKDDRTDYEVAIVQHSNCLSFAIFQITVSTLG